jgi:hypothetical protein
MNATDPESPSDLAAAVNVAALAARVHAYLGGRVRDFRLELCDGRGLVLRGRAPTYYAKQVAQHAVMAASRLPIAANEIEVR